ncbi:polysaccharide biosynthesis C-terminal domain-containing protein [Vibrio navarrensis]|uniref:polysaccharide biosynthesis C-terminal domain-containing protein n=1 Tax=Vibrio navarrensis TaxID=29495 RepID=UPI0015587AB7|nr:polysaccharide biosynthesis C-terminal domain-containing protein [Vibrio navarrensis]
MEIKDKVKRILSFGILANIITVLSSILLARFLGSESRGALAVVVAYVTLSLPIVSLGLKQAFLFFIVNKNVFPNIKSRVYLYTAVIILSLISVCLFDYIYQQSEFNFFVLSLLLSKAMVEISAYKLLVDRKSHFLSKYNFARAIFELTLLLILSYVDSFSVVLVLTVYILGQLISLFLIYVSSNFNENNRNYNDIGLNELIKKGVMYSIPLFLINVNISVDIIMLGKLGTLKDVGVYQVAVTIANLLWIIPNLLGGLILSESSQKKLKDSLVQLNRFYKYLLFAAPILTIPLYYSDTIFEIVFGTEFRESGGVFNILFYGFYSMVVYKITNGVLAAKGKTRVPMLIFTLASIINIALNLLMIPRYGANGAAYASLISYLIISISFVLYVWCELKNET